MPETAFPLKVEILPPAQRRLWDAGLTVPEEFVLYGGTALALRLGHRESVDFDFFSATPFRPAELLPRMALAANAVLLQSEPNTLTFRITLPDGDVKFSFFGGIHWSPVRPAVRLPNGVALASLEDLYATKLAVIIQRSESKDYLDIAALIDQGMDLAYGLACARAFYGADFNTALPLKALCWFGDGDLALLSGAVRHLLTTAVQAVRSLPNITGTGGSIGQSIVPWHP